MLARIIRSGSLEQIIHRVNALHQLSERGVRVVKPLFGSMGLGMLRVTDEDLAWRVFRTVERIQGVYYPQQTVPHDGSDIRAFVGGGRILGAIERRTSGWRTNVSRGGEPRRPSRPSMPGSTCSRAVMARRMFST